MEVTDRVHVVALGWEVARIVDPLFEVDLLLAADLLDADVVAGGERVDDV